MGRELAAAREIAEHTRSVKARTPAFLNELMLANDVASVRKHQGKEHHAKSTTAMYVFHYGPVALEFGPAVQKDSSDAPNSKFLIGFGSSSLLRVNFYEIGPNMEDIFLFFRDVKNSRETSR